MLISPLLYFTWLSAESKLPFILTNILHFFLSVGYESFLCWDCLFSLFLGGLCVTVITECWVLLVMYWGYFSQPVFPPWSVFNLLILFTVSSVEQKLFIFMWWSRPASELGVVSPSGRKDPTCPLSQHSGWESTTGRSLPWAQGVGSHPEPQHLWTPLWCRNHRSPPSWCHTSEKRWLDGVLV